MSPAHIPGFSLGFWVEGRVPNQQKSPKNAQKSENPENCQKLHENQRIIDDSRGDFGLAGFWFAREEGAPFRGF